MSNLSTFVFNQSDVRVLSSDNEPWFVAKDLCDVLELSEVSNSLKRLDEDEKQTRTLFVSGQNRDVWVVSESGMYALVLTSRKPQAKSFKKWITSEVLPSIRKTGKYEAEPTALPSESQFDIELKALEFAMKPLKEYVKPELVDGVRLNYIERKIPHLKGELDQMRSLIAGSNKIDTVLLTPTKIGQYLGERLGVKYSAKLINQLLIENGYQVPNPKKSSKDDPKYLPTEKGKPFSNMSLATGKGGDNTSFQHLKWLESILDELENIVKA